MSHIVVEPELSERLKAQTEPAELVDARGLVLGRFFPATAPGQSSGRTPELDRAGFEAALAAGGSVFTAELLANLERQ